MGILIALPGVLATIVLAPWVLSLFYSPEFIAATGIIRWQIVGTGLRVISWPLGFMVLAKGRAGLYAATEVLSNLLHGLLIWAGLKGFGLDGVGMAFAALYVCYTVGMVIVARRLTGFRWSGANRGWIVLTLLGTALTLLLVRILPGGWGLVAGMIVLLGTGLVCLRGLERLLGFRILDVIRRR